jgi:hypothetical protein
MSLPQALNYVSNKPLAGSGKPYINRYRSDNSSYVDKDIIRFEIPTGRQGSYIFPSDCFIEGKIKVTSTSGSTASTTAAVTYIDQSIYSIFNRMRVYHGNVLLEDVLYTNKIWTSVYDLQVSGEERRNDCITKCVFDSNTSGVSAYNTGVLGAQFISSSTNSAASTSSLFDFAIVLPSSILGSLAQKALPVGLMGASSIYLELELAPVGMAFVGSATVNSLDSYSVQDIYFNAKQTTLPTDIDNLLIQSTGGIINLPAVAYKSEAKTIATSTSNFNDKFSFQFSSLKNFMFFVQNSATAIGGVGTSAAIKYRSITARPRANISEFFLTINGESYPSQPVTGYARTFAEVLRAWDSLTDTNGGGIISLANYTIDTNTATDDVLNAAYGSTVQKRYIAGLDLDRFNHSSDTLMSGTSSIGQLVNLQLTMTTATSDNLTLYAYVQYDVLYHLENGLLSPKF